MSQKKADEKAPEVYTYQAGEDPEKDAWYAAFFIENHIDYYSFPHQVATPEQIGFMVMEAEERYFPCSDDMFRAIMGRDREEFLNREYRAARDRILALIDEQIEEPHEREYLRALIDIKFRHETQECLIIPSRLLKRLLKIFLNHTQIADPWRQEKTARNRRAQKILRSAAFARALEKVELTDLTESANGLSEIRERLDYIEFKRLLCLMVCPDLWRAEKSPARTTGDFLDLFKKPVEGDGLCPLLDFLDIRSKEKGAEKKKPRKILWLADESGEIVMDLALIRYLANMGHKVVISFMNGPYFTSAGFYDTEEEPVLAGELNSAFIIKNKILSKNELVKILKHDTNILVLSDGTMEPINLLLTSTSFARVFKEMDGVISRGALQRKRFFESHFSFTQDIFNIARGEGGAISILHKPRHPSVIKFSHHDLEEKAKTIIAKMADARKKGKTVIFYSGIIGSIPGKIGMAKKIMTTYIDFMKKQHAKVFIINPSDYYEPGMDADDLMYMWEIVQRSGYIDTWRFQTYEEIAKAFNLMGRKVPPEWVGKDATYSTGCTKEMRIALDVLKEHPEMQVTGPSREKFRRRDAYGIGKMYDQRLNQ